MNSRKPHRLQGYNYSNEGMYFITICTHNKENYFGHIHNNQLYYSDIGIIAKECWGQISEINTVIEMDYYVIMPNHVHGILIINSPKYQYEILHKQAHSKMLIPKIVQGYKGAVTKRTKALDMNKPFKWQASYYDHIIRNEKSLNKIREYIVNNPLKWQLDVENQECIKKSKDYYKHLYL